ncbi:MAG TPA: hypothetical protein VFR20_10725 [Burkholderiaceae bacterium]|nr:hypothetical protein [Burkholderiaceae bacterium]
MRTFVLVIASLLLSLLASIVAALGVALVFLLVWEAFDLCAAFGGPMEGSCGYAFSFFFMPIIVLSCLIFVTILAYRKIHPWLVRRLGPVNPARCAALDHHNPPV